MSDQNLEGPDKDRLPLPDHYRKHDRRYRESKYFLADQLRYSEPVKDFQSVRDAILRSSQFDLGQRAFQFARVAIQATNEPPAL